MLFASKTLQHARYAECSRVAHHFAATAPPGSLIFLVGPSGAGKSTIARELQVSLAGKRETWPEGELRTLSVLAHNASQGYFHAKDFWLRLLAGLHDPFRTPAGFVPEIDQAWVEIGAAGVLAKTRLATTEDSLRRAAETLAPYRNLRYLIIDEAQLIGLVHRNRRGADYLESLKVWAIETAVVVILVGTFALLDLWNHTAQSNRRSRTVHVSRYRVECVEDVLQVRAILKAIMGVVPVDDESEVQGKCGMIMDATAGVFGEIEALFERAKVLSTASGSSTVSWRHIEAAFPYEAQHQRLLSEIVTGEAKLKPFVSSAPPLPSGMADRAKSRRKPGRRNPVRDLTGPGV